MVLKQLVLERFKRFHTLSVEFSQGLNVIRGENEAGKSTLREAILTALYANPVGTGEALRACTTWGQAEPCSVRLTYADENGGICQVRKDFAAKKAFWSNEQEHFKMPKTIQNRLAEDVGLPSAELYTTSCALDVRSLSQFDNPVNRRNVGKILSGLMTGSGPDQDAGRILKRLDEALRELAKGERSPSKTPGPIKASRDRLARLQAERHQLHQAAQEAERRGASLREIRRELDQGAARLADLDRLLAANAVLGEARRRTAELTEQDAYYDRRQRAARERAERIAELDQRLESSVAGYRPEEIQELQQLKDALTREEQPVGKSAAGSRLWPLAGLGVFLLAAGAVVWSVSPGLGFLILGAGAGAGMLAWREWGNERRRVQTLRRDAEHRQRERIRLQSRLSELLGRARGRTLEQVLAEWPEAQQLAACREALLRQHRDDEPVDETTWGDVRRNLRLAVDQAKDPDLLALEVSAAEAAGLQREQHQRRADLERQTQQHARLQALLEHQSADSDKLRTVEEELHETRRRLDYLVSRERVLQTVRNYLEKARTETLSPARQILEQRAAELFGQFSGGRYRQIMVDGEDLSSKIWIPEHDRWEDPGALSQGTFDQFYLALRLALSEILAGGHKPPLLLDEPFAAFDERRRDAALEALAHIAQDRQVLIFTCRRDLDRAADHLIALRDAETSS